MAGKCFIILGMHRSATSLIAKGLHEAGVNMGDNLLGADSGNPYGYWEDVEFLNLNKYILATAGGNWIDLPDEKKIEKLKTDQNINNKIQTLVRKKNNHPLWGWKDPRTIATISLYTPYIDHPHFIPCFRDPVEVAKSLNRRNGFDIPIGINIAREYNFRLIKFLTEWFKSKFK